MPSQTVTEVLQTSVTDHAAEQVSDLAITDLVTASADEESVVAEEESVVAEEESVVAEEESVVAEEESVAAEEADIAPAADVVPAAAAAETEENSAELMFEDIDKTLYGNETTEEKIARLRKQANAFIREARELEKSLPNQIESSTKCSDMREIDGIMYSVDDKLLYNRCDELVGFIERDEEVTFTEGWNKEKGTWDY